MAGIELPDAAVATAPPRLEASVAALQEEMRALRVQIQKMHHSSASNAAEDSAAAARNVDLPEEFSLEAPRCPYSFVMSALLDYRSNWWARAWGIVVILVQLSFQVLLCWAFFDSSDLMAMQSQHNLYISKIPTGQFYLTSSTNNGTPIIYLIAALLAIALLGVKINVSLSHSSLMASSPIEHLLFLDANSNLNVASTLWELAMGLFVQMVWATRLLLLPLLVCYGSITLWFSEGTATDIVKDSVVVAYVIELDELFYKTIAPKLRAQYERAPGLALAPGRTGPSYRLGKLLMFIVDAWFMVDIFFGLQGISSGDTFFFGQLRDPSNPEESELLDVVARYAFMRSLGYSLTVGLFIWYSTEHNHGLYGFLVRKLRPTAWKLTAMRVALIVVAVLESFIYAFLIHDVVKELKREFGHSLLSSSATNGTWLMHCLGQFSSDAFCSTLSESEGDASRDASTPST